MLSFPLLFCFAKAKLIIYLYNPIGTRPSGEINFKKHDKTMFLVSKNSKGCSKIHENITKQRKIVTGHLVENNDDHANGSIDES